jgi:hypothetical protein
MQKGTIMKRYAALLIILIAGVFFLPTKADAQLNARGHITMLRVHDLGTAFGPPTDRIDVEVVITLDSQPGKAFGFQLRNDPKLPARQGMLDLLRDAFATNAFVNIDFITPPGKNNGTIIRTWLTR